MNKNVVRPIAICVIRRNDDIFVFEGHDFVKGETFYRPLGGGIEFGEHSRDAVAREVREEIGQDVVNLRHLGAVENIFTCNGKGGHEIVMVYEGEFADPGMYECKPLDAVEDNGERFKALWMPLQHFRDGLSPLYPDGLLELLAASEAAE
jgi:8-oxo-dGTP pyrophosphatase MutT (NUDIX family)